MYLENAASAVATQIATGSPVTPSRALALSALMTRPVVTGYVWLTNSDALLAFPTSIAQIHRMDLVATKSSTVAPLPA